MAPAIKPLAEATRLEIDTGLKTGDFACISCSPAAIFSPPCPRPAPRVSGIRTLRLPPRAHPKRPRSVWRSPRRFAPPHPPYVAEAFLRAEGFTEVQYVRSAGGFSTTQQIAEGEVDFGASFAGSIVYHLDAGLPLTALGGLHTGCFELFVHPPICSIGDLKGRRVGIQTLGNSGHLYVSIMAKHVGLDPQEDIEWVVPSSGRILPMAGATSGASPRVLMNLVSNAIKFTEAGSVMIRPSAADGSFLVAVTDTGGGIARGTASAFSRSSSRSTARARARRAARVSASQSPGASSSCTAAASGSN